VTGRLARDVAPNSDGAASEKSFSIRKDYARFPDLLIVDGKIGADFAPNDIAENEASLDSGGRVRPQPGKTTPLSHVSICIREIEKREVAASTLVASGARVLRFKFGHPNQ